ncbi:MAG: Gfo/Idh/MocA family oxidoreductase [Propionibacteriaceae bacterium]|jgi:predicted dehydrogenase|nr:Gfo/Idh/MocA family oxidoreductase [Propionibacteriaceae bacterium]
MTELATLAARTDFITGDLSRPAGRPLSLLVLGGGSRGSTYAAAAVRRPDRAEVVGLAEPRPLIRDRLAAQFGLRAENVFSDWREVLDRPRLADIALVTLQDAMHVEAATALADRGYQLLLEKPMATTWEGCLQIADAVRRNGTAVTVCHVMRYTPYTLALKAQIAQGAIGDIVALEHLEPVGYYHYAHSFVRGNWANEQRSTFMLLAKSCHDIDWILDVVGAPAARVTSMGALTHFRRDHAPVGSADRCLDCAVEAACPFSAVRIYSDGLAEGGLKGVFLDIATGGEPTAAGLERALREGPYGRCVYRSDNNVVDHQIVGIEFANQVTASFTMTAFTPVENRRTRIFGTRGELTGDGRMIEVYDFLTEKTTVIDTQAFGLDLDGGHGGGDDALLTAYIDACYEGRPDLIVTNLDSTLASHKVVFAAEQARLTGTVVTV